MKKIIAIVALFASMAIAGAQQLGVTGGLTLSKMNGISNPKDTKAVALYSAGVLYKANLGAGFAIQPELLWQVKGANVQENVGALDNLTVSRSNNVELGLGLQWGPDLLAFRPYLFVEPFLGYSVGGKESQKLANADFSKDKVLEARNKLEYGVGGGIGVEIASHIQLSFPGARRSSSARPVTTSTPSTTRQRVKWFARCTRMDGPSSPAAVSAGRWG